MDEETRLNEPAGLGWKRWGPYRFQSDHRANCRNLRTMPESKRPR